MKTLLIILITLASSQYIYRHYGQHNILARTTDTCVEGVRWALRTTELMLK